MACSVPPPFQCPISLEVMKDPVIISTGHTYERANIEKWLKAGHRTCPVTMMPLRDASLIPNVIVQHLIQAWRTTDDHHHHHQKTAMASEGSALPSTDADIRSSILSFLQDISKGQNISSAMAGLKELVRTSNRTQQSIIVSTDAPSLLASLLRMNPSDRPHHICACCEDALSILSLLSRNSPKTQSLVMEQEKLSWIVWHLRFSSAIGAKLAAASLLGTFFQQDDTREAIGATKGVLDGLVSLLTQYSLSSKAQMVVLKVMERACESRANRYRAVDAGAVAALVDLLKICQRACTERVMATMELLCDTVHGQDAASRTPDFFPSLVEKMTRVSHRTTEHATTCMLRVCSLNREETLRSASEAGVYPQLLLVLQGDGTARAKWNARELLKRLHSARGHFNHSLIR